MLNRRILACALCLAVSVSLVGCGSNTADTSAPEGIAGTATNEDLSADTEESADSEDVSADSEDSVNLVGSVNDNPYDWNNITNYTDRKKELLSSDIITFEYDGNTYEYFEDFTDWTASATYSDAIGFILQLNRLKADGYDTWMLPTSADMAYAWWESTGCIKGTCGIRSIWCEPENGYYVWNFGEAYNYDGDACADAAKFYVSTPKMTSQSDIGVAVLRQVS